MSLNQTASNATLIYAKSPQRENHDTKIVTFISAYFSITPVKKYLMIHQIMTLSLWLFTTNVQIE